MMAAPSSNGTQASNASSSRSSFSLSPSRRSRTTSRTRNMYGLVCSMLAMMGGLALLLGVQFVLFPLLFTILHSDEQGAVMSLPQSLQSSVTTSSLSIAQQQAEPEDIRERRRKRREHLRQNQPSPDGTFNGAPIYLQTNQAGVHSNVHCVGENYQEDDAWKQRSCRFSFLCMDTSTKRFQLFQSKAERTLSNYLIQRPFLHTSTTMMRSQNRTNSVSLGGINQKWGRDIPRLEWFPDIVPVNTTTPLTYYALPDDVVLIPFHSLNGANPGHFVWDDLLPIYTLLSMFQLLDDDHDVLALRFILDDGQRGLWASCDLREERTEMCRKMMKKFLPLLTGDDYPYQLSTTQDFEFVPNNPNAGTNLVCAKNGLAGIGSITDHGVSKSHGWMEEDYQLTHNHGRGGMLYNFRNFMLQNMGLDIATVPIGQPHRIIFSQKSSDIINRSMDFERQMALIRERFPDNAQVEGYVFKDYSLPEQLQIVHDASIYVTLCGGGAVTGMFLPKGASVIIYYAEDGGVKDNRMTFKPARLDWDLFNAMSHLRVHWMPRNTHKTQVDEDALSVLIYHELALIEAETFV